MADTVTFTVDAKHAQAIQAFIAINSAMNTTATKADELGGRFGKAGEDSGKGWEKGLGILGSYPAALLKMVTGTTAVLAITAQLRAEYERMGQLREKALGFFDQIREPAQRAELSFEPGFSQTAMYKKATEAGVRKSGGNAAAYFDTLGAMASARGHISQTDTLAAADLVAELMGKQGFSGEDSREIGGALMDAMNNEIDRGGTPNPREILGSFISSFGATRSTKMGEFARYDMRFINTAMRSYGFSRPEAVGLQSAVGGAIPDPTGRRTSTANNLLLQKLSEAYRTVDMYGQGVPGMDAESFDKSGMKMLDIASSDTETGRHMRAYMMGINSDEQAVKNLAVLYGGSITFGGHYQGEAGAFPIIKNLLTPGGKGSILERAKIAAGTVRSGPAAIGVMDSVLGGPLGSEQQKLWAARTGSKGLLESLRYQNTDQARRGNLAELVEGLGEVVGTGATQQTLRNMVARTYATGGSQEQIGVLEAQAAGQAIEDIKGTISQRAYGQGQGYLQWAKGKYGPPRTAMPQYGEGVGAVGAPTWEPYSPEIRNEWLRQNASREELLSIEALQQFRASQPTLGRGAGAQGDGLINELRDLTSVIREKMATGGAAELSALQFDIGVDDKSGRPLSRATSRSKGIELLND